MLKAPSNEYEHMRAGMEYKLALQAIRKIVRTAKGLDYDIVMQIADVINSMEEDLKKRCGSDDERGEDRDAAESSGSNDQPQGNG